MGFLQALGIGKKSPQQLRAMLPQTHAQIDVMVRGGSKGQVFFEGSTLKTFTTSALPGLTVGATVVFSYKTASGRYRFSAPCVKLAPPQAIFDMPASIQQLEKFAVVKRTNVRLDTTTTCQWRFAPTGKIETDYRPGSITDISRSGASLIIERELKAGTQLELKIALGAAPVAFRGEVKRIVKVENTNKTSHGVQFAPLTPAQDKAIIEFINRRQTDLRNRGLA